MHSRIIRITDIATTPTKSGLLPVSPATIWRWVRNDKFPRPFKLSAKVTAWYAADIDAFIAQRAVAAA